ncbi:MAG: hypothetical protein JJE25_09240 [Bacteroidia bacterium]|nr:hypothetical protein [Bacteroidia bacterium]
MFIITAALLLVAGWLILNSRNSTVRKELRDFAVKDTAAVTKIFLADRAGKTIELEREMKNGKPTGNWYLNKKYYARRDAVNLILETLHDVSMRSYLPKTMYNTVVRQLSTSGVKCEVYLNGKDKPEKVMYIGSETQDSKGTFMMLENSSVPFVTEIPGFDGFLTPRFFTNEQEWRWKNVFNYLPDEIRTVTVSYNPDTERSFKIDFRSAIDFSVSSPAMNKVLTHSDTSVVINYISQFSDVNFEFFDFMLKPAQRDSILKEPSDRMINVTDKNGKSVTAKFYKIPVNPFTVATTDTTGELMKYDVDRMYAFINHDSDLVGVQLFVFRKFFRSLEDFDAERKMPHKSSR